MAANGKGGGDFGMLMSASFNTKLHISIENFWGREANRELSTPKTAVLLNKKVQPSNS